METNSKLSQDLGKFSISEMNSALLLVSKLTACFPKSFSKEEVRLVKDERRKRVFVVNKHWQRLAVNEEGILEEYYVSPYTRNEGFFDDLAKKYADHSMDDEDELMWFRDLAERRGSYHSGLYQNEENHASE